MRVCQASNPTNCADFKIALIRGDNATKDEKLQFTVRDRAARRG